MAAPKRVPVPSAKPPRPSSGTPAAARPPRPKTPQKPVKPAPAPRPRITKDSRLRVLVGGASGMIGTELRRQLEAAGHTVKTLVRRPPQTADEYTWAPDAKILDFRILDEVDAVINLSGASLTRLPWTSGWKKEILRSRVKATEALVEAMAMAQTPPAVFLSGSAVGFYGDRPGEELSEDAPRGDGFLADVVAEWEGAARLAPDTTRTVLLRTGVVLGPSGALAPLRTLTKTGLGGPLGHGEQHWPWIGLHDEAAAIVHLLTSELSGPVNLAGPEPATAGRIGARIAAKLHRPFALRAPERLVNLALGEAGREMLFADQKVLPAKLLADGFAFRHSTVDAAVDAYA